jgi:hypothetical protein
MNFGCNGYSLNAVENIPRADGLHEVLQRLSALERKLMTSLELLKVMGKRGSKVPVLIPTDCQGVLKKISNRSCRLNAGIKPDNIYLFANHGMSCQSLTCTQLHKSTD